MFRIILFQPEIPPNTGNIIRLCANTGCELHLIKPLGFELDEKRLRRAGLDYREWAEVQVHDNLSHCLQETGQPRVFAATTKGKSGYHETTFRPGDALLFGPETRGLPDKLLQTLTPQQRLRIPMQTGSRSLNLSNTVAIFVYEALRQNNFINMK